MVFALFYCSFFKKWSIAHPKEENKRVIKKKRRKKKHVGNLLTLKKQLSEAYTNVENTYDGICF